MRKWQQPAEYTGVYPNGWAGYTWLDYDSNYNVYHPGEDLNWTANGGGNEDLGRDVWAIQDGKVVHTSSSNAGYGNIVVVEHTLDGDEKKLVKDLYGFSVDKLYSLYAHLNSINTFTGATVTKGQKIATIGKSGTPWAHLHYEISIPDNLNWRFYPTGWSKERVKTKYIPAYNFIEKTKITSSPQPPMNDADKRKAGFFDKIWIAREGATDTNKVTEAQVTEFIARAKREMKRAVEFDRDCIAAFGSNVDSNAKTSQEVVAKLKGQGNVSEVKQKILDLLKNY